MPELAGMDFKTIYDSLKQCVEIFEVVLYERNKVFLCNEMPAIRRLWPQKEIFDQSNVGGLIEVNSDTFFQALYRFLNGFQKMLMNFLLLR
jgi:hypothetical protein